MAYSDTLSKLADAERTYDFMPDDVRRNILGGGARKVALARARGNARLYRDWIMQALRGGYEPDRTYRPNRRLWIAEIRELLG